MIQRLSEASCYLDQSLTCNAQCISFAYNEQDINTLHLQCARHGMFDSVIKIISIIYIFLPILRLKNLFQDLEDQFEDPIDQLQGLKVHIPTLKYDDSNTEQVL